MQGSQSGVAASDATRVKEAREALDRWVREVVAWHFDPATGCPFWLERAKTLIKSTEPPFIEPSNDAGQGGVSAGERSASKSPP